jgi:hypothetical protein
LTVIDLAKQPTLTHKRKHRRVREVLLTRISVRNKCSYRFDAMVRAIRADLGGADQMTEIEKQLVETFAAAALLSQHFTARLMLVDDKAEVDVATFTSAANALSRIGAQLGLSRRQREVLPSLNEYLRKEGAA